ncbi:MAG: DUF4838 domain-containing protein [Armatimonadota bacterium]
MRLLSFSRLTLVGCVALLLCAFGAEAAGVTVIKDGQPLAKIYLRGPLMAADTKAPRGGWPAEQADAVLRSAAARDLQYHLQQMSGAALEIVAVDDPAGIKGPAIIFGELAAKLGATAVKTTPQQEGYRLLTKGTLVLIGGESDLAAQHGMYALLRKLGCDWVFPGEIGEVIPQKKTVEIPQLDEASAPDFQVRSLWYRGYNQPRLPEEASRFEQWKQRQAGGGRGNLAVMGAGGHVWDQFIKKHQAEFDKDPTMYALRRAADGTMKRMGPQLESTHPRVIELFIQDIKSAYEKNIAAGTWTKDTVAAFGIGPADGLGYSMSPEALAAGTGRFDPIVGEVDRTDELVLLGNRILEEVCKEYPNCYVGFYSYSTHADFPAKYQPHPHIVQIFAPINFSRLNSVLDPNSKTQAYYRGVVEQWGKLSKAQGNPLIYRGYNWNLAENLLPYSKVRIWGEELPFYKTQGIIALNVEATKQWATLAPSDYVFMRLAWDSSQKWQHLLHEYCVKAFGAGAAPMERHFTRIIDAQQGAGQEAGSYHAYPQMYDDKWVQTARADLAEATKLAKLPEERARIEAFGGTVEMLQRYLTFFNTTKTHDFATVKTAYDAMHALWQQEYNKNTDMVSNEGPAYLKRYIERFVDQGVKFSSAPYRMVVKIPDELPTAFDPNLVGHNMQFQSPAINDRGWIRTKTFSSTWDAQGLASLRTSAVWYRHRFTLPADAKGQPIGLFIGGVEDEARVWINGKLVGTSGRGFSVPSQFDLTDDIRYDGENVLAVQVTRNSMANEIGLGGIIRPCFIFTGPRLPTKAPKPLELRRILPGGELGELEG